VVENGLPLEVRWMCQATNRGKSRWVRRSCLTSRARQQVTGEGSGGVHLALFSVRTSSSASPNSLLREGGVRQSDTGQLKKWLVVKNEIITKPEFQQLAFPVQA